MDIFLLLSLNVLFWGIVLFSLAHRAEKMNYPKLDLSSSVLNMLSLAELPLKGWSVKKNVLGSLSLCSDDCAILITLGDYPNARLYGALKESPIRVIDMDENLKLQFQSIGNIMTLRQQKEMPASEFELIAY